MSDFIRIDKPLACRIRDLKGNLWSSHVREISENAVILAEKSSDFILGLSVQLEILGLNQRWTEVFGHIAELNEGALIKVSDSSVSSLSLIIGPLRKDQHIELARFHDVEGVGRNAGFSEVQLLPNALADLDFADIDTSRKFLGRSFSYPFLITGMTGGLDKGAEINHNLAHAASKLNIPMGVGSQRVALEDPNLKEIFRVKQKGVDLFLIANLGAAQLLQPSGIDDCMRVIEMIEADALAIHLNLLQELIQVEGDRKFKGILAQLTKVCKQVKCPVIVKEVGCGIHPREVKKLISCGVHAVDIAGRGGTSWARIEGLRSSSARVQRIGETFRDWGLTTVECLKLLDAPARKVPIIATGGVRNGLQAAKALALGASMVGIGLPLFRAACVSKEAVVEELETIALELRIAMLASGSACVSDLTKALA